MTNFNVDQLQLGARQSPADPRTLRFTDYLKTSELPIVPKGYSNAGDAAWQMFGNDRVGDCVMVAIAHKSMQDSADAGTPDVPSEAEVVAKYFELSGGLDVGLVIKSALSHFRKNLWRTRRLLGYAAIDPRDLEVMKLATFLFGAVGRGILLPNTAKAQSGPTGLWQAPSNFNDPNARPQSWGAHMTLDVGYTESYLETVTWGYVQKVHPNFYPAYSMESWALVPLWPVPGFDQARFINDLRTITSGDIDTDPAPPPPPPPPEPPKPVPGEPTLRGASKAEFEQELLRRYGDLEGIDINLRFRGGSDGKIQWPRGWSD